jgi:hypothetical protein
VPIPPPVPPGPLCDPRPEAPRRRPERDRLGQLVREFGSDRRHQSGSEGQGGRSPWSVPAYCLLRIQAGKSHPAPNRRTLACGNAVACDMSSARSGIVPALARLGVGPLPHPARRGPPSLVVARRSGLRPRCVVAIDRWRSCLPNPIRGPRHPTGGSGGRWSGLAIANGQWGSGSNGPGSYAKPQLLP